MTIVGVFQYLSVALGVNGNNIALQILLKIEGIEGAGGVAVVSVLDADGRAAFSGFNRVDSSGDGVDSPPSPAEQMPRGCAICFEKVI